MLLSSKTLQTSLGGCGLSCCLQPSKCQSKAHMKPAALMPKVNKPSGTDGKPAMRNVQKHSAVVITNAHILWSCHFVSSFAPYIIILSVKSAWGTAGCGQADCRRVYRVAAWPVFMMLPAPARATRTTPGDASRPAALVGSTVVQFPKVQILHHPAWRLVLLLLEPGHVPWNW